MTAVALGTSNHVGLFQSRLREVEKKLRTNHRLQTNSDAKRKYSSVQSIVRWRQRQGFPLVDESYWDHHRWRLPEAWRFPEDRNSKDKSRQEKRKHTEGEPGDGKTIYEKADNGIAFRELHRSVGFGEKRRKYLFKRERNFNSVCELFWVFTNLKRDEMHI